MNIKTILLIIGFVILFVGFVVGYSTFGSPSEFGNETTTTCWIGGDDGNLTCLGNITGNYFFGNGSQLTDISYVESEPYWSANYSTFLTHIDWSKIINGTIWSWVMNGSVAKSSELNNGTYVIRSVLNNGSYLNYPWNATNTSIDWTSLTNYPVACPEGSYVTQINDSITCTVDTQTNSSYALITEPLWSANYTAYNESWSNITNYSYVPYTGATGDVGIGIYNFTASWFNGRFNWTSTDTWNIFDGYSLTFNESKLETIYYNATQSEAIVGTIDGGTLEDTKHSDGKYNGLTFNFSEEAGSPGLDLRINFTGIEDFNRGVMRYKTSNLAGDYPLIQMWNYDNEVWEDYPPVGESSSFATITQPVFDSSDHVSGNVAQMRIYKSANGNTNNHYYVDWIAIAKGYGTPSGEEVDPYSWHRGEGGESGNFTTTGNVSANHFIVSNGTSSTPHWNIYEDINGTLVWEKL